jgi:cytochrome c peroxidase
MDKGRIRSRHGGALRWIVAVVCSVSMPLAAAVETVADLGRLLYFDANLSWKRTQSCATCHAPDRGFADPRESAVAGAGSLGDDGRSLGDRNTPSIAYAAFSPPFAQGEDGSYRGGQFLDGRASDLAAQAAGPLLNPIEMGMPDAGAVTQRLRENPVYVEAFARHFGDDVLDEPERGLLAAATAIAAFESTDFFAPFDSRFDRYLRGEYRMTAEEDLGMTLFFSQQFTNCNRCHQLQPRPAMERETFSDYSYHNIGTPANLALRQVNGKGAEHVDRGLLDNPVVDDPAQAGRFKVPTLRNVAVTGPYMHNGVFGDLRTVVLFYNKYNSRSPKRQVNPETGEPWRDPEVAENLSLEDLEAGPALDDRRIDALVAFMRTLTDRRYEDLLESATARPAVR